MKYKDLIIPHLEKGSNELFTVIEGLKSRNIDANNTLTILTRVAQRFEYISEMINNE